jgi:hypothetical protein
MSGGCYGRGHIHFCVGWNYSTNHRITAAAVLSWINAANSTRAAVYRSEFINQPMALMAGLYVSAATLSADLATILESGNRYAQSSSDKTTRIMLRKRESSIRMHILPGPNREACIRTRLTILDEHAIK